MSHRRRVLEEEILQIVGALQPVPHFEIRAELRKRKDKIPPPEFFNSMPFIGPKLVKLFRDESKIWSCFSDQFTAVSIIIPEDLERQGFLTSEMKRVIRKSGYTYDTPHYSRTGKRQKKKSDATETTSIGILGPRSAY